MIQAIREVDRLLNDILESDAVLFRDDQNVAYIAFDGTGRNIAKVISDTCKQWITMQSFKRYRKAPTATTCKQVQVMLEAQARFEGEEHPLAVRVAQNDDGLWYDLGGSAVCIKESGWEVVEAPPILFNRYTHQRPQVVPERGGSIELLAPYFNVASEQELLLVLTYIITAFLPDFPHVLLILYGSQGAGKSTPMQATKRLIDPSALDKGFSIPNEKEFAQIANHHLFLFFDNLATMPDWFSDALARTVTGNSFSKRGLFTDDTDIIYSFQRTVALNGIDQVVSKSDLLDRSILIRMERISAEQRKERSVYFAEFERDKPLILGAIFDTLAKALALYPTVSLSKLPRMADFAKWGYVIGEAAGWGGRTFLSAYSNNIDLQHDAAIEASPVATVIVEFMRDREKWSGQPAELYGLLHSIAIRLQLDKSSEWPKDAVALGRKLNQATPNLSAKGVQVDRSRPKERIITLTKTADTADGTDAKNE